MERRFLNAFLIAAIGAGSYACSPRKYTTSVQEILPKDTPTLFVPNVPTQIAPETFTPVTTQIPTEIPTATENLFKLGSVNFATTPFTLQIPLEVMKIIDYTEARSYHSDFPLPITGMGFGTPEQQAIFEKAAKDNSSGNPYYVMLSDKPGQIFVDGHSLQWSAASDASRVLGGAVNQNPDKLNQLIGQKLILTPKGHAPIEAEIAYIQTVSEDFYDHGGANGSPWGFLPYKGITIARTKILNIPETIRNDKTPNVYYLTIVGCQNKIPGNIDTTSPSMPWAKAYALNTANRSLLTLKIVLP